MFYNRKLRNSDLVDVTRNIIEVVSSERRLITVHDIIYEAIHTPAPSFYVDFFYARRIVRERLQGVFRVPINSMTGEMWNEIERQTLALLAERGIPFAAALCDSHSSPKLKQSVFQAYSSSTAPFDLDTAIDEVLERGHAPRFYVGHATAYRIISESIALPDRTSPLAFIPNFEAQSSILNSHSSILNSSSSILNPSSSTLKSRLSAHNS